MVVSGPHESLLAMPVLAAKPDVTVEAADCHESCGRVSPAEGAFDMAACLAQVRARDEEAARVLMDRLYPLVLKIVRAHRPRRTAEEDLVQTVFMKVFVNLDKYSGKAPVEHWVSRIAVNTCFNELKAERIRPEWRWSDLSEEEQHMVESLSTAEEHSVPARDFAARDLLEKLMAGLNATDRLLIQLLHLEERSVAEIRQMTGWTVPVIKVRAFRARRKLQKYLDHLGER
jgi:RNA polymerase sigma factor (sigma-70 family)